MTRVVKMFYNQKHFVYKYSRRIKIIKMNFTLLFAVVGNLNFIVKFLINADDKQNFFLFDGVNSSAYLYRNNHTVFLYLRKDNNLEIYKADILNSLEFSWLGFKVNGTEMEKIKSTGELDVEFHAFTFISPILNTQSDISKEIPLANSKEEKISTLRI